MSHAWASKIWKPALLLSPTASHVTSGVVTEDKTMNVPMQRTVFTCQENGVKLTPKFRFSHSTDATATLAKTMSAPIWKSDSTRRYGELQLPKSRCVRYESLRKETRT